MPLLLALLLMQPFSASHLHMDSMGMTETLGELL